MDDKYELLRTHLKGEHEKALSLKETIRLKKLNVLNEDGYSVPTFKDCHKFFNSVTGQFNEHSIFGNRCDNIKKLKILVNLMDYFHVDESIASNVYDIVCNKNTL